MTRRPPGSSRASPFFPLRTLFRSDDRSDGILRDQAAGIDFDRVAHFIVRGAIHVEALERRLIDVERVEVERNERRRRVEGAAVRIHLTRAHAGEREERRDRGARTAAAARSRAERDQAGLPRALTAGVGWSLSGPAPRVPAHLP